MFESGIAEDAAILTGIGIGTAFSLLVVLMLVILVVHWITERLPGQEHDALVSQTPEGDAGSRERALAAVVAVTALLKGAANGGEPLTGEDV